MYGCGRKEPQRAVEERAEGGGRSNTANADVDPSRRVGAKEKKARKPRRRLPLAHRNKSSCQPVIEECVERNGVEVYS